MEKCVSCFLVYSFLWVLILFFEEKKLPQDEGFKILYENLHQVAPLYTTNINGY